jgi:hypothetical protein
MMQGMSVLFLDNIYGFLCSFVKKHQLFVAVGVNKPRKYSRYGLGTF